MWLSECYQHKTHTSLGENVSPMSAFRSDKKALRFISSEELIDAFLHCEARKVDKAGCISFQDKKYEVGISFVRCKVDVLYDPADVSKLTIEYQEYPPWKATELVIGEQTGKRPELPETLQKLPVDKSRLLRAAEKQRESRLRKTGRKPCPVLFSLYPLFCTLGHEYLYNIQDTFLHHTAHRQTLAAQWHLLDPFDRNLLPHRRGFLLFHDTTYSFIHKWF